MEEEGEPGDGELSGEELSRLARAALLLSAGGVPLGEPLSAALAALPPVRLLAADHLVSDPAAAAAAAAQPQGAEWEAAGLLAPARVVARLEAGLGLNVARGEVARGPRGLAARVDLSVRVPAPSGSTGAGERRVVVAVLDEECYCSHPPGRLRGSSAAQVLALQSLGWAVAPLPAREWLALGGDAAAQDAYLRARIAAAVG